MALVKWCLQQKNGLELVESNSTMADSYLRMAEESLAVLPNMEKSNIWKATTSYYIFYYSLYALMLRIGIKCEIHSCSLAFMRECLGAFYTSHDTDMIAKAFSARIDLQYYANRPVNQEVIEKVKDYCSGFYIKTKDTISSLREGDIDQIRENIKALLKENEQNQKRLRGMQHEKKQKST